ncbi:MAG: hypothetical protein ACI30N_00250 [Muribaculaceae bacterium]
MTKYSGKASIVNLPAAEISGKFADMTAFNDKLAGMPEDVRQKMGELTFTRDTVCMDTRQAGKITFKVTERDDRHIVLACAFPLRIDLVINLNPVAGEPDRTEVSTDVDIDIPAMLRPIIGPQMQKVADHFGAAMGNIAGL